MTKKEYLKKSRALQIAFIRANDPFERGQIVKRSGKLVVILEAKSVNKYGGIEYDVVELDPQGRLSKKGQIYGFEALEATGKFMDLTNTEYDDDLL